jgi:hypothetical protein
MSRGAVVAAALALAFPVAPARADERSVSATCDWAVTGVPDTTTVLLQVVIRSHVQGPPGVYEHDVECTVWTDAEAAQFAGASPLPDQVFAGLGALTIGTVHTCVRASVRWTGSVDTAAPLSGRPDGTVMPDDTTVTFADPPGCLPPCHLVPRPSYCPPPALPEGRAR